MTDDTRGVSDIRDNPDGRADRDPDFLHARYWRRTSHLTLVLLLIWFVVTFIAIFFARQLAHYTLFGWPISFFMAAQGSILIYVTLIGIYALCMRRLDRHHRDEHEQQR